jgi:RHS repeat-associated protein
MPNGLDYFGARYFAGVLGRFTGPDGPLNDQSASDPQSWNLYSYGRNNPLRNIDPTGRACVYSGPEGGDVNNPDNYTTIGTEHGTCNDAFSNDVPLSENARRIFTEVVKQADGPVNLVGYPLVTFLQIAIGRGPAGPEFPNGGRLRQDINVDPKPPAPNDGDSIIGTNPRQDAVLREDIATARAQGATDIRTNQQQVTAKGARVGINRPDLQYTLNGRRYIIEYETEFPGRGGPHIDRATANDPNVIIRVKYVK